MPFFDGWPWWPPMMFPLFPIVFMALGLLFCFYIMKMMMGGRTGGRRDDEFSGNSALEILDERYAAGQIDRLEYEEKRRTILQGKW